LFVIVWFQGSFGYTRAHTTSGNYSYYTRLPLLAGPHKGVIAHHLYTYCLLRCCWGTIIRHWRALLILIHPLYTTICADVGDHFYQGISFLLGSDTLAWLARLGTFFSSAVVCPLLLFSSHVHSTGWVLNYGIQNAPLDRPDSVKRIYWYCYVMGGDMSPLTNVSLYCLNDPGYARGRMGLRRKRIVSYRVHT
jgi:hypothetical protein